MNKIDLIQSFLDETYPNVGCELLYEKDYELVIAVMLSAQTTDKAVNNVTKELFSRFPNLLSLSQANIEEIEKIISKLGLAHNKAKNVVGIAKKIVSDFHCELPYEKDTLMTLPGIGNKSAGVIRAEVFKIPDFPVDTHIARISKRLSLANENDDPLKIELKLKKKFNEDCWIKLHHQLIHFGRSVCLARSPKCEICKLHQICNKK